MKERNGNFSKRFIGALYQFETSRTRPSRTLAPDGVNLPAVNILESIRGPFGLGPEARLAPLGNGHINQTRLVTDGSRRLVAQRINTAVFGEPEKLVRNALRVESFLSGVTGSPRVVRHLCGNDGAWLHGPGNDVRVLEYVPGSYSAEVLGSARQAEIAARCFARFSRSLDGVDRSDLAIVIPDFHNPEKRWMQFEDAVLRDPAGRSKDCGADIDFAMSHARNVANWQALLNELPERICHNDCKINNLLVSRESGEPLAIIDLDTCMPGRVMTDFGDLVRTCCSPEPEDSKRLDAVRARTEIYRVLLEGYLEGWSGGLTKAERESLLNGGPMMSFIVGLRFLTDYVDGDRYFSTSRKKHNLDRARNQFQLFRSLEEQAGGFTSLV